MRLCASGRHRRRLSEIKIEEAIYSTASNIKAAATVTETARPDLPTSPNAEQALVEEAHDDDHS